jgi:hypothetical protein
MDSSTVKKCRYCGKEVNRLAEHIIRMHPSIMEKLEEIPLEEVKNPPVSPVLTAPNQRIGNLSVLIQEKLDLMLNIKIIEMLSKSPDTSIQDIAKAINPPEKTTIQELKEYHDLVYPKEMPYIDTGNDWVNIIQQAIPIVKEMMPKKKNAEVPQNVRTGNSEDDGILQPIQLETATDQLESKSTSKESRTTSDPG